MPTCNSSFGFAASTQNAFSFVFSPRQCSNPFDPQQLIRTNSLGRAASDCHTCKKRQRHCDRQRPRCNTCTAYGRPCGGFAQELNWQEGIASRRKLNHKTLATKRTKESIRRCGDDFATASSLNNFSFVRETGVKRDRRIVSPRSCETNGRKQEPKRSRSSYLNLHQSSSNSVSTSHETGTAALQPLPSPHFYRLSSQTLEVLNFYWWKFSLVTLTFPVQVNPWHVSLSMAFDNPCLMDAAMALSHRYRAHLSDEREDIEVLRLKARALSAFSSVLCSAQPTILVGTILTLIGLEYVATAYSNWPAHFRGAFNVINSGGGIEIAHYNPALQAQIAQLAWYDTVGALLSRRRPIFPRKWIQELMDWRLSSGWTLLALNGCPDEFFLTMYDIADAASRKVGAVEAHKLELRVWAVVLHDQQLENNELATLSHCWRLGLLLYCTRVFWLMENVVASEHYRQAMVSPASPQDTRFHRSIATNTSRNAPKPAHDTLSPLYELSHEAFCKSLAERILWLVQDLPEESNAQKQCLIPLSLAAAELGSYPEQLPLRIMAENYCRRWQSLSGLRVFDDTLSLLRTAWATMAIADDPRHVWWATALHASTDVGIRLSYSDHNGNAVQALGLEKEWLFG